MRNRNLWCPQLFIPQSFGNALSYAQQIRWLYSEIVKLQKKVEELESKLSTSTAEDVNKL